MGDRTVSSVKIIGLRCDGCKDALREDSVHVIFQDEVRKLHAIARRRGWLCRKWTGTRVVDVCPNCVTKFEWKREQSIHVYHGYATGEYP